LGRNVSTGRRISAGFLNQGAGQPMIGTVLMLFCGLPAMTRSL
jgi:hypothetical protein